MNEVMELRSELKAMLQSGAWAIDADYLGYFAAVLAGEMVLSGAAAQRRPKSGDSVAVLSLSGVITPKPSLFTAFFGGTALTDFVAELDEAVKNPKVAGIVINVDSPGGLTDLVPETAQKIREAREAKLIIAVANTDAYSAAYWLASQAGEVAVTPSGMVGSIGVYSAHTDFSGFEEQHGLKTTLIAAGKYKIESNPYEPLSDEAAAAIQERVDSFYSMFVSDVAAGRGVVCSAATDGFGQGRPVTAKDALAEGMVDRIDTLENTLARTAKELGGQSAASIDPRVTALRERARFEKHRFNYQRSGK